MKKIFLTSILSLMVCPSFATGISVGTNPADCTESVLDTTSGTSNLEASWTANTLNIEWYDGDTKITTTTCTYDGGIVIPDEEPEKTGYTFNGWTVRRAAAAPAAQCSLSDVDTSINGTGYGYTNLDGNTGSNEAKYGLTTGSGEWATEFEYGIVKGVARCSLVGDGISMSQIGNPTDDLNTEGAEYCWCKVTDYTQRTYVPDGESTVSDIFLTGYGNSKMNCIKAVKNINGMAPGAVKTFVESASAESPQLIEGATSADIDALTTATCIVTNDNGVVLGGHYEEEQCLVGASRWVYNAHFVETLCANSCVTHCANNIKNSIAFRRAAFFGIEPEYDNEEEGGLGDLF